MVTQILLKKRQNAHIDIAVEQTQGVMAIAGVTVANGGDNIGVYTPLLATLSVSGRIIFGVVFVVLVFVWCWLAHWLSRRPQIARTLQNYGHIIMPIVLLLLGIFILFESGAIGMLMQV